MLINPGFVGIVGLRGPSDFLEDAATALAGNTPHHYFDFINNTAIFSGASVGGIASIPNRTGTLDLSASGQLIDAAGDAQTITSPNLNQTYTMFIEFTRSSDTGALVRVGGTYTTTESDRAVINVSAGDTHQATTNSASATAYNASAVTNVVGTVYKVAMRIALDDTRAYTNGTAHGASGTVALPATPDTIKLGATSGGGSVLMGHIRRVAFFNSALTNAQLQVLTA